MKYVGMPQGMWALFAGSFRQQLTAVLGYDPKTAKAIVKKAKPKYKAILAELPEFEKNDRFQMNIVNFLDVIADFVNKPDENHSRKNADCEIINYFFDKR